MSEQDKEKDPFNIKELAETTNYKVYLNNQEVDPNEDYWLNAGDFKSLKIYKKEIAKEKFGIDADIIHITTK